MVQKKNNIFCCFFLQFYVSANTLSYLIGKIRKENRKGRDKLDYFLSFFVLKMRKMYLCKIVYIYIEGNSPKEESNYELNDKYVNKNNK